MRKDAAQKGDGGMNPDLERDGYAVLSGAVPEEAVRAALRCIGLGIRRLGLPGGAGHAEAQGGTFLPELRDDPVIWALIDGLAHEYLPSLVPGVGDWAEPQILLRFPDEAPEGHKHVPNFDGRCLEPARLGGWCLQYVGDPIHRPALVPHVDEEPEWAGHEYVQPRHSAQGPCIALLPNAKGYKRQCAKFASDPSHQRRRYKAIVGVALTDNGEDDGALYVWPGTHKPYWPDPVIEPVPVLMKAGDAVVMEPRLAHAGSWNLGSTWQARVYFRLLGAVDE